MKQKAIILVSISYWLLAHLPVKHCYESIMENTKRFKYRERFARLLKQGRGRGTAPSTGQPIPEQVSQAFESMGRIWKDLHHRGSSELHMNCLLESPNRALTASYWEKRIWMWELCQLLPADSELMIPVYWPLLHVSVLVLWSHRMAVCCKAKK